MVCPTTIAGDCLSKVPIGREAATWRLIFP
jgi:hypothetical protein